MTQPDTDLYPSWEVIGTQEQPSPGSRRVAAFGVDYGIIVV
jgi:hypothetical protein